MDPPRSEAAFAAALPLNGLNAWRIYLGLPMCGARLPSGGPEALMRLFYQDAVLKGYQPIAKQGAAEFPAALMAARQQLGLDRLHSALTKRYSDPARVDLIVVPGMGHALAEEPGISPAPQTEPAAAVDQHAMSWLRAHLPGCTM
jgi:pimeloyl-ACP methyl ester carboxylesterase